MSLNDLKLYSCQNIQNWHLLNNFSGHSLDIVKCNIDNIPPIKKLKKLHINYCDSINDFSPLSYMQIDNLHLSGLNIKDISVISNNFFSKLTIYSCKNIIDLDPLENTYIKFLKISYCKNLIKMPVFKNVYSVTITKCPLIVSNACFKNVKHLQIDRKIYDVLSLT
jgi:hypothetical protein